MTYTIKQVSQKTGLSIDTLRYYDKMKIVSPIRKENRYRCYSDNDITKLEYAVVLKYTGFSLQDIKNMMQWFDSQPPCDNCNRFFNEIFSNNIAKLKKRISTYQQIITMTKEVLPLIENSGSHQKGKDELSSFVQTIFRSIALTEDMEVE